MGVISSKSPSWTDCGGPVESRRRTGYLTDMADSFWTLDPDVTFLNHGSFGSCPRPVQQAQSQLRERMERQPVQFFARDLEEMLDAARAELATFVGAAPEDLAWVPNATTGLNAVLRSYPFQPGDELLTTDHEYNACTNALRFAAERSGARVIVAELPFPTEGDEQIQEILLNKVSAKTRLALIDHITSPTGLVLPIERIVRSLKERGVETLVDGAHAVGMLDLDLEAVGAAYYTGNCHKWLCAPKGAAFLHVRRDLQSQVRPISISHGANSTRTDRSRFQIEFDWTGTDDPTALLCVPEAIRAIEQHHPGGWPALREHNRLLAIEGRRILCDALGIAPPCPESMLGSLAAFPISDGTGEPAKSALYADPLQDVLLADWSVEVPIIPWPERPHRICRISAQAYNRAEDYLRLGEALVEVL